MAIPTSTATIANQTVCSFGHWGPLASGPFNHDPDKAVASGKVVFRNALIELIQYSPATSLVAPQPMLFVPSWPGARGIVDVVPGPDLLNWLVARERTVFAIAWQSPDDSMRNATLEDYSAMGVMAALDVVGLICGNSKIHMAGDGAGSLLLNLTASTMGHDGDNRLGSVSLIGAQTDLTAADGAYRTAAAEGGMPSPPRWQKNTPPYDRSWWPCWAAWLVRYSGPPLEPPSMDFALGDAPGATVLEA